MTIDVATLVFEFKSDSAGQAEKAMDRLIEKGDRLDAVSKRVRLASDRVNEGYRGAAGAAERAAQGAMGLATAQGAVEKATQASLTRQGVSWREFVAERMGDYMRLEGGHGAAMKRIGAEWQAYKATATNAAQGAATAMTASQGAVEKATHSAARAASTLANQQERAARTAEVWQRRIENMEKALDPASAVTVTLAQRTRDLDKALAANGISSERHASMLTRVREAAAKGDEGMTRFSRGVAQGASSAKLQAHELANLSFQLQDVIVSLASGQKPMMVAVQQGSQIGQVFQGAAARGVSFKDAVLGLAASAGRFLLAWAPVIGVVGAAAGAFLLWRKHLDDVKAATKATAEAVKNFADVQAATRDALASAVEFTEKYGVANGALTDALDKVLVSQNAAYGATMSSIDANDAAGRSAFRRAEIERLLTVSILKRAAAEADSRAKEADAAAKAAKGPSRTAGILAGIGLSGDPLALQVAAEAEAAKFKKLGGDAAEKAAAQEREYAKTLNATADALLKAKLILPEATKATAANGGANRGAATGSRDLATATAELDREIQQLIQSLEAPAEKALREYNEATLLARKGLDAGRISAEQFRDIIDRLNPVVVKASDAQKAWNAEIVRTAAEIPKLPSKLDAWIERMDEAVRKYEAIRRAGDDLFYGIKNQDWSGAFSGLLRVLDQVQIAFSKTASAADKVSAVAGIADSIGNAIGGRGGKAISSAANAGATAFQATGNPYVAAAAAAIAGLSKLLGPKPTNAGAGYDLTTGAISGNKRTSETEQAATAAGQAIQGIQDSLKAAGIGLTDSVRGLVIGTRDQTQIYLASGRELRSAVGDSGAAVDTAMRALLEGATYVSDAQKKLVDSALAAGKGFDAIAEILAQYEAAQKISGNLADEILRLTKPQAYDEQAVRREIEEARKSYQKLATDGYLTADQLLTINGQLATLEGLRLDEVMKRYANSVDAANDNLATLRGATESAEGMLRDAYDAYASAKQAEIAGLLQAADSLRAFRKELDFGAIAGRDPLSQYAATKREFDRLNALSASDPERLANLQSVSQAFLEASKIASPTELAFNRDLQAVRRATEASEMAATAQADYAQMQLDAQTAAVGQLITLNATAVSIEQAMFAVLAARANEVAGGGAANDNLDVGRYLALNPDLAANWNAGGSLRGAGMTLEDAARAHYATTGKWEVSQGLRTYATGGMHPGGLRLVGEEGPELEVTGPSRIYSARETAQMMGGDSSELLAEVRALRETVASQADQLRRIAVATDQTQSKLKDFEGNGMFVRGRTPDDAVETVAA